MVDSRIGGWTFIVGLVIAAAIALFAAAQPPAWAVFVLAVGGIIAGLLNIQDREIQPFLLASIAFLLSFNALSAVATVIALGWAGASVFFDLVSVFVATAAAVVAVKAIYNLARD